MAAEAGKGWLAQRFGVLLIPRRRQQAIQRTHGARKCGLPWATSQRSGRRSHTGSSRLLTSARATQLAFRAATCSPHVRVLLLCVLAAQARGGTGVEKSRGEHLGSKGHSRRAARTYQRSRCSSPPTLDCRRTSSLEQRELEPMPRPSLPAVRPPSLLSLQVVIPNYPPNDLRRLIEYRYGFLTRCPSVGEIFKW